MVRTTGKKINLFYLPKERTPQGALKNGALGLAEK